MNTSSVIILLRFCVCTILKLWNFFLLEFLSGNLAMHLLCQVTVLYLKFLCDAKRCLKQKRRDYFKKNSDLLICITLY